MKLPSDGWLAMLMIVVSIGLMSLGVYEGLGNGNFIEGALCLVVGTYALWRL